MKLKLFLLFIFLFISQIHFSQDSTKAINVFKIKDKEFIEKKDFDELLNKYQDLKKANAKIDFPNLFHIIDNEGRNYLKVDGDIQISILKFKWIAKEKDLIFNGITTLKDLRNIKSFGILLDVNLNYNFVGDRLFSFYLNGGIYYEPKKNMFFKVFLSFNSDFVFLNLGVNINYSLYIPIF